MRRTLGLLIGGAAMVAATAFAQTSDQWAAMDWSQAKGVNAIKGSAFLRTRGGEVRTCAGYPVHLIPSSPITDKWAEATFGTPTGGLAQVRWRTMFGEYDRETTCDAQGNFQFDGLPDGRYHVVAKVEWEVARQVQGGLIARRLSVSGGSVRSVTLSD